MSDAATATAAAPAMPLDTLRELAAAHNSTARPGRRAHTTHLHLVYNRGAAAAPHERYAHVYGLARAHAFLTLLASGAMPVNPIAPDRDLLPPHHPLSLRATVPVQCAPLRPLRASIIVDKLGRPWKSFLHPRDKNGRFIPTFGGVQVFGRGTTGVSDKHYATGRYMGANPDGSVRVRLNATNDPNQKDQIGRTIDVPSDQVASMASGGKKQKASIGGHLPQSEDEDSIQYRNEATQDAFDEGLARLGDKDTPAVNVNGTAYNAGDRISTQIHSEENGKDEIASRNGTIEKIATTKDGAPNALVRFDGEADQENPDGTPEYSIIDLNAPGIAKSDSAAPSPGARSDGKIGQHIDNMEPREKARLFPRGEKDPTEELIRGTQQRLEQAGIAPMTPPGGRSRQQKPTIGPETNPDTGFPVVHFSPETQARFDEAMRAKGRREPPELIPAIDPDLPPDRRERAQRSIDEINKQIKDNWDPDAPQLLMGGPKPAPGENKVDVEPAPVGDSDWDNTRKADYFAPETEAKATLAPPEETGPNAPYSPEDVVNPAQANPQRPPAGDIADINRESTTVGMDRPAAPRLEGHEQVGERITPPNKRKEVFGIGDVVQLQVSARGRKAGQIGQLAIIGNINYKKGGARLYFQDENGEWYQSNTFFAYNSLHTIAQGDVDYLTFMRNAHDARGRGLLPGFKRIAPLQPKGSDTATDQRIALGADGEIIRKGDHVAGVRDKDGAVVQGIVQNITPRGDTIYVIPYGGGDKIAISPNGLRWVRNASSSYTATNREDIFIDKNMDHKAASPDRESLGDVLVEAGFSQATQDAVETAAPDEIGDILRADPAHEQLMRRVAAAEALKPSDPERHSSANRAARMHAAVVRAGEAGRLSGETVPRKPPPNQVSRESAADEFEANFPEPAPKPTDTTPEPAPEPEAAPSEEDFPEPPPPAPEPEPAAPEPEPEPEPVPEPAPAPVPEVAEPEAAPEVMPTPEAEAPEVPAPAPETPEAPKPAPAAPPKPAAMSPVARAGQGYRAMAQKYKQHPNQDVQAFGRDLETLANRFDEIEALRARNRNKEANDKLRDLGLTVDKMKRTNRMGFQRLAGPGAKPEDRALVAQRFMPLLKNAENLTNGGDRALTPDTNPGFFNPNAPAGVPDRAAAAPGTPELPSTEARDAARAPGGGGSLADQVADLPNPSETSAADMDAAYRELMDAIAADPKLSGPQKLAINGALTRGRRAIEKAYDPDRTDDERENLLNAAADRINGLAAKHRGTDVGEALEAIAGRLESIADDLPTEATPTPPRPAPTPAPGGRRLPRRPTPPAPAPTPTAPGPEVTPPTPTPESPPTPAPTPAPAPGGGGGTGDWDFGPFDPETPNPIPGTPAEPDPAPDPNAPELIKSLLEPIEGDFPEESDRHRALANRAVPHVEALYQTERGGDVGNLRSTLVATLRANGFQDNAEGLAAVLIQQWAADKGTKQMEADGLELHSDEIMRERFGRVYSGLTDPSGDVNVMEFGMALFAGSDDPKQQQDLAETARGMAQLLEHNLPQTPWRDERIAYYQSLFAMGGKVDSVQPPQTVLPNDIRFKFKGSGPKGDGVYPSTNMAAVLAWSGSSYNLGIAATPEEQLSKKGKWGVALIEHDGHLYSSVGKVMGAATAQQKYNQYVQQNAYVTSERTLRPRVDDSKMRDDRKHAPGAANWHEVDAPSYDDARKQRAYDTLTAQMAQLGGLSARDQKKIEERLRTYLNAQNMDPDTILLPTARVIRNGNVNMEIGQDALDAWGPDAEKNIAMISAKIDQLMSIRGVHDKPVSVRISDDSFMLSTENTPAKMLDNLSTLAWAVTGDHSIAMKVNFPINAEENNGEKRMLYQTNSTTSKHFTESAGGKNTALTALGHEWGHLTDLADHDLTAHNIGAQNKADQLGVNMTEANRRNRIPNSNINATGIQQDDGSLEWYDYDAIKELAVKNDPTLSGYSKSSPRELRAEQFSEWVESNGQTTSSTVKFFYGSDQDRKDTVSVWFKNSSHLFNPGARARRRQLIADGWSEKDASWQAFRESYGHYNRSVVSHGLMYVSLVGIAGDQDYYKRLHGTNNPVERATQAARDAISQAAPTAPSAGEVAA